MNFLWTGHECPPCVCPGRDYRCTCCVDCELRALAEELDRWLDDWADWHVPVDFGGR